MSSSSNYIDKTIDRYRFDSLLGKGTFGEVYKAFDTRLLRHVAIKVFFPYLVDKERDRGLIMREAQIIARAEHANIVPIYDVLDHDQTLLIVMRLIKGESLGELIQRLNKAMDYKHALEIISQVLRAIASAHAKGVVHSDLKPGNILVTEDDEAIIMDFGLAALLEVQKPKKGKLYGTPFYMPPEQINGTYLDARSDIYSLGMILYRMITGRHPFHDAGSVEQLLFAQKQLTAEAPCKVNPAIPEYFSNSVLKSLEKDPSKRYHSCLEFLEGLENKTVQGLTRQQTKKDMRWDPRANTELTGRMQSVAGEEYIPVKIINLSTTGASLQVPYEVNKGSEISLEFEFPEEDDYVRLSSRATVLWSSQKDQSGACEIGVGFIGLADMDKQYIKLFVRNLLLE